MSFLFQSPCTVDIKLTENEKRNQVDVFREKGRVERLFVFVGDDPVRGQVQIVPTAGKKLEHKGIKIDLVGHIG